MFFLNFLIVVFNAEREREGEGSTGAAGPKNGGMRAAGSIAGDAEAPAE